jgi:hypothetical protein
MFDDGFIWYYIAYSMQWNIVVCAQLSGCMATFEGPARHTVGEAKIEPYTMV